jgi:hydrogenase-4 component B
MDVLNLLLAGLGALAVGALLTFILKGEGPSAGVSRAVALLAVGGAAACFIAAAFLVLTRAPHVAGPFVLWRPPVIKAALTIRVDALSAFFLLIISVVSVAATWFAVGYTRKLHESLRGFYPPFLLFILGMAGVVMLDDFFFFFVPWEFMALSSYALVIFHKERKESLRAGFKYFFITHAGTLALFFGVTLLVTRGGGSFEFDSIAKSLPAILTDNPAVGHFALLLILLGFMVKAGLFPFGMWWLPDAHPAAPSPVSALLSGVMIKLGLYGILRVFFVLLPAGPWSFPWGIVIALFGVLSLFFGTMAALVQHDSKRLLAYHSIGQVGYMALGFGIGLAFMEVNPVVAALGLVGGLFHLLNHACFKGLLFLNAGAFEVATGERDLNRLGGLGRLLPVSAVCTVVASLAIAGLPLFSGFSSKWILYHASLWGGGAAALLFLFFGIVAIFISAVTLASFLKFMGATIWGAPGPAVTGVQKSPEGPWLSGSQIVLAIFCLGFGIIPVAGAWLCHAAAAPLLAAGSMPPFATLFGPSALTMTISDHGAVVGLWSPVIVGLILLAAFALALVIRRLAAAPRRAVATWACGSEVPAEELRFRADGYYTPFKKFVHLILPEWRGEWRPQRSEVPMNVLGLDRWLYQPVVRGVLALFRWFARSHVGVPQVYAAWLVIGFIGSMMFLLLH